MLVSCLLPPREAADRVRRYADLLGDEGQQMKRHHLAWPQNAAGIPEDAQLERESEPHFRRSISADDLDILGAERVVPDEGLLCIRQ